MNLEQKLRDLDNSEFLGNLRTGRINPANEWRSMPYLKYNLTEKIICEGFKARGVDVSKSFEDSFEQSLYSGELRKEPLKMVYYGIKSSEKIPNEIIKAIKDEFSDLGKYAGEYALIYFYAGIWDSPMISDKLPVFDMVSSLIKNGIKKLYNVHYNKKDAGNYSSDISLPYTNKINKKIKGLCKKRADYLLGNAKKQKPKQSVQIQSRLF